MKLIIQNQVSSGPKTDMTRDVERLQEQLIELSHLVWDMDKMLLIFVFGWR